MHINTLENWGGAFKLSPSCVLVQYMIVQPYVSNYNENKLKYR